MHRCRRPSLRIEIAGRPAHHVAGSVFMGFPRYTSGITREDLTRDCLRELRLWPGCETVGGVAVLVDGRGKFTVHVVTYGLAKKKNMTAPFAASNARRRGTFI